MQKGKIGCPKCEYTGFAFGKIPCECRDNSALISESEHKVLPFEDPYSKSIVVSGCVPISSDYGICYYGDNNKPMINIGEWVTASDVIVGVALTTPDKDGMIQIMAREGGVWLLDAKYLQKCPPNWNPGAFL